MRKTARPVVWEGVGAQSAAPDPITQNGRQLQEAPSAVDQSGGRGRVAVDGRGG